MKMCYLQVLLVRSTFSCMSAATPLLFNPRSAQMKKARPGASKVFPFTLSRPDISVLRDFVPMSGFEVAGIVLGSIPIVVSALQCYMNGLGTLQSFRSYKRILKRLILTLKTEHVNLQNICEKLLTGIAPQTRIEEMIRDPFGDLWREEEIFNKLRLRLWSSLQVFDDRVQDMREAIEEMMEKLNVGTDGNV